MPKAVNDDIYDDDGNKLTSFKALYAYKRKLEAVAEEHDGLAYQQDAAQADHERNAKLAETAARDHRYDRDEARKKVATIVERLDLWSEDT